MEQSVGSMCLWTEGGKEGRSEWREIWVLLQTTPSVGGPPRENLTVVWL